MIQRVIRNGIQASTTVPSLTVTGAITAASAAISGAATVGTTLGVTGATTLTGDVAAGNVNMGSGKVLTLAAGGGASTPSLVFAGSGTNTGLYASTADQISFTRLGTKMGDLTSSGGVSIATTLTAGASLNTNGSLIINAAFRRPLGSAKTSNYVLLSTENGIVAGTGCSIVTTPASPSTAQTIDVINQSGGPVTLTANTGQTIDGAGTVSLADNSSTTLRLANDAVTWYAGEAPAA